MRKHLTWSFGLAVSAAVLVLSGCGGKEPVSAEPVETVTESAVTETTGEPVESSSSEVPGQSALREAMVLVNGELYIWSYDLELSEAPEDYTLAGTVEETIDSGKPDKEFQARGLDKGAKVYIREGVGTALVDQNGSWSAFIPYGDVASAYEYSRDPWTYDASGKTGGFRLTLPDGSWTQEAGGDWSIDSFSGNGGTASVIYLPIEEAEEIYPYIDTEEECRDLILNTGAGGEFTILEFEAGLADSDTDPDASYYHFRASYDGEFSDYAYEERYALYCGGGFWQLQILMRSADEAAQEMAAGILDSFAVPTCESQ